MLTFSCDISPKPVSDGQLPSTNLVMAGLDFFRIYRPTGSHRCWRESKCRGCGSPRVCRPPDPASPTPRCVDPQALVSSFLLT